MKMRARKVAGRRGRVKRDRPERFPRLHPRQLLTIKIASSQGGARLVSTLEMPEDQDRNDLAVMAATLLGKAFPGQITTILHREGEQYD